MKALVLALYAEGSTDNRFLPLIIRRTAERIIAQYGRDTGTVGPAVTAYDVLADFIRAVSQE